MSRNVDYPFFLSDGRQVILTVEGNGQISAKDAKRLIAMIETLVIKPDQSEAKETA